MGKGNLFLGYGRGKVGDIVFSRTNGVQTFRARNRNPRNPRTNKQLIQRSIMATIMQAYSAGKEIFDHAFQGYSVGEGCQRRFMTVNLQKLRTQLSLDYDSAIPEEALAKVTAPGIATVVPNPYVISEGTYDFNFMEGGEYDNKPGFKLPSAEEGEKLNEYAARTGLIPGDIYTYIFVATSYDRSQVVYELVPNMSTPGQQVYRGYFGWIRFIAKDVSTVETVISNDVSWSDLFEIEIGGSAEADFDLLFNQALTIDQAVSLYNVENSGYCYGFIRSRRDQDLRSTSSMEVVNPENFGLYWEPLLEAWRNGVTPVGASDLILEGGDE